MSVEVAKELRDALGRRQKELPPRWLAAFDAATVRDAHDLPSHAFDAAERELGLTLVREALAGLRPRAVVCVQPSASRVSSAVVNEFAERGSLMTIAATELDAALASSVLARVLPANIAASAIALACDCTVELPLPDSFPRPRVYLCLGNVIGSTTTVGAVRMLRVLRTTMNPGDVFIIGLETRADASEWEANLNSGDRHLRAFGLVGAATGADLDLTRFEYRRTFDSENSRHETHIVARRATQLAVPGVCDVRFKKGESIRTSVSCVFDRTRLTAMMGGVGLTLHHWLIDPTARFAVALAIPAV